MAPRATTILDRLLDREAAPAAQKLNRGTLVPAFGEFDFDFDPRGNVLSVTHPVHADGTVMMNVWEILLSAPNKPVRTLYPQGGVQEVRYSLFFDTVDHWLGDDCFFKVQMTKDSSHRLARSIASFLARGGGQNPFPRGGAPPPMGGDDEGGEEDLEGGHMNFERRKPKVVKRRSPLRRGRA